MMRTPYLGLSDLARKLWTRRRYDRLRDPHGFGFVTAFGLEWDFAPEDDLSIHAFLSLPNETHPLWGRGRHCNALVLYGEDCGPERGWQLELETFVDLEIGDGAILLHPRQFLPVVMRAAREARQDLDTLLELGGTHGRH